MRSGGENCEGSNLPAGVMLNIPVAILAGGLATRLQPLTEKLPKVLLPVAGKPFLAHQLELLKRQGINRVILCLGHLGDLVQKEFGTGQSFGVQLDYSFDGAKLLGTGGAIRHALPKLGKRFFVTYGDSYLPTPFAPITEFFANCGKSAVMTVYRNEGLYDASNVVFRAGEIIMYDKKKRLKTMHHIDYGLSLFRASVFQGWPAGQPFDLAEVLQKLVAEHDLAGFEVPSRFYEIGSPAGLVELDRLLTNKHIPQIRK